MKTIQVARVGSLRRRVAQALAAGASVVAVQAQKESGHKGRDPA